MLDTLRHRGPDDSGVWSEGAAALGARRLAVIDLAGGHQPLCDASGRFWIAYNGEVYNFRDLRLRLEREGARFRTGSDTEVVVEWFARRGADGLRDLNGMFAFAVWDRSERCLWLARDRCGKKPAYYAAVDGGLVFASELRTVVTHPRVSREIDPAAVAKYLAFDFVPSPGTALRSVRKLEPGTVLRWRDGRIETRRYWTLPQAPESVAGDLEERVRDTLARSVRRRLVSDVPLGVLLSGGVDSSAVAAFARTEGRRLRSFSVGFDDAPFDESRHAQRVAEHLGTDHRLDRFAMAEAAALAPEVLSRMDDLLADSSVVPTYLVSRAARRHVTVVLSGDGGDELFAGYPTFFAHRVASALSFIPRLFWRGAGGLARLIRPRDGYLGLDVIARRFCRGMAVPGRWRNQAWLGAFAPWEIARLLPAAPPAEAIYSDLLPGPAGDSVERALAETFRFYLGEGVLTKVDRASMMVSLEVRSPFLDDEMIDLAWSIPWTMKMSGGRGKVILKRALSGMLPASTLHRRKQGFAMPLRRWLTGDLRPWAEEFLFRDGFDSSRVRALWRTHLAGACDLSRELWSILAFQVWRESLGRWPAVRETAA